MRSSVRSGRESYAIRSGFHGPSASRRTPQNPRGSGVFSTRPCPWLRSERFVGSVGRQPEQITLPFDRRSASPSLVALQRAIFQSQGTSTMPPSVTRRKRSGRPVSGFPNRYGIPCRLWFARHRWTVMPSSRAPEFSFGLGPTHPCAKAVHTEPFPSSILQVPARAPATTTKICTDVGSGRAHAQTLPRTTPRPSYSPRPELVRPQADRRRLGGGV